MCEMLATLERAAFVERVAVNSPANVRKAKKAIKECFQVQLDGKGFGIVEFLSTCPTNWGVTPVEALKWVDDNMIPYYPLGNFKKPEGDK
jgi:2-oxoglutarate ferredoxin oxidoreductase subunit beta